MSPKKISIIILATLLISTFVAVNLSYDLACKRRVAAQKKMIVNPLYDEFTEIGKEYNLDMSFMQYVGMFKKSLDEVVNQKIADKSIFKSKRKSYDVILVGDSTMALGTIPQVIEQMSGLKVGAFYEEALSLNDNLVSAISKISRYYLRDNGMIVLSFTGVRNLKKYEPQWVKEISGMTTKEFEDYIDNKLYAKNTKKEFDYREQYKILSESLKRGFSVGLPDNEIYLGFVEPFINTKWFYKKREDRYEEPTRLMKLRNSLLIKMKDVISRSLTAMEKNDPNYIAKEVKRKKERAKKKVQRAEVYNDIYNSILKKKKQTAADKVDPKAKTTDKKVVKYNKDDDEKLPSGDEGSERLYEKLLRALLKRAEKDESLKSVINNVTKYIYKVKKLIVLDHETVPEKVSQGDNDVSRQMIRRNVKVTWDETNYMILSLKENEPFLYALPSVSKASRHYEHAIPEHIAPLIENIPYRKAYIIALNIRDKHYVTQRSIYEKYYSSFAEKIDLGSMLKEEEKVEMIDIIHTVNTGNLYRSIMIGQWLKDNFEK